MIPYVGGKSSFANEFLRVVPKASHFYDLFGGGGAVTEAAYEFWRSMCGGFFKDFRPKFETVHYNELQKSVYEFACGMWSKSLPINDWEKIFVSKELYTSQKKGDEAWNAFVRIVWSFNGAGDCYIAQGKRLKATKGAFERVAEKINSIKNSPMLAGKIETTCLDYRQVKIEPDSVVYCDIPYLNVKGNYKCSKKRYDLDFSHEDFYEWALSSPHPVYHSDYDIDPAYKDRFDIVFEKDVVVSCGMTVRKDRLNRKERVFWNRRKP
jgi:site-specific DNA-adenine methylase